MAVRIDEISNTYRNEPGEFREVIERYMTDGWTLGVVKDGKAMMTHPLRSGVAMLITDQDAEEMGR